MRLCARGGGDSSHAASDCVGRGKCWQVGRAISTRSELLMSGEKSMPTRELLHLGAEVAVMVVGEAVVCCGLEKRRGKCVGRPVGLVRATCLAPLFDTVLVRTTAEELALGNGWRRRRAARKQIQRLAVCTRNRRGRRGVRVFASVSCRQRATKTTTVLLFAAGKRWHGTVRQSACRAWTIAILGCCW